MHPLDDDRLGWDLRGNAVRRGTVTVDLPPSMRCAGTGSRGGWVDRALTAVWAGESADDPVVAEAYRTVFDAARRRRDADDGTQAGPDASLGDGGRRDRIGALTPGRAGARGGRGQGRSG